MPVEKYPLTSLIECQVAFACATMPRFMNTLGYAVDPEAMPTEAAGLVVQSAKTIAKEAACTDAELVIQHIRWRVHEGQLTNEQLVDVIDFVDTCNDIGGVRDLDALVATVRPIVQRAMQKDVVDQAMADFGKGVSAEKAAYEFQKVAAIGHREISLGHESMGSADEILEAAQSTLNNPLDTGILEVDGLLSGGLEEGGLGCVLGGSGDGKSLFLSSVAANAIYKGIDVAYVTLELSEASIKQRVYCNLLSMTPDEMKDDPSEAAWRYQMLARRPGGLGRWVACYMSPKGTTPADIKAWLGDLEKEKNFKPGFLAVDYADHMVSKVGGREKRSYDEMKDVYTLLRNMVHEERLVKWLWTASQTRNREGRKKKVGLEDTSDSAWKFRVADLVLAIERSEEDCANDMIRFSLPKRRNAQAHGEVGPLPMDAGKWRIVVTNRSDPW